MDPIKVRIHNRDFLCVHPNCIGNLVPCIGDCCQKYFSRIASESPPFLLNKKTNFSKYETESKIENPSLFYR